MKQRLLRRLLAGILFIILGTFIAGQIAGFFVIRDWYVNQETREIVPDVREVAERIASGSRGLITLSVNPHFIIKAYDLNMREMSVQINNKIVTEKSFDEQVKIDLQQYFETARTKEVLTGIVRLKNTGMEAIVIGLPIKDHGTVTGVVFAIQRTNEFNTIIYGFYLIFFITCLISTIIILALIYYSVRKLIKPLTEMTGIANSMAEGDFDARIKEAGYGEIKELSVSFNHLARRLSDNDKSAKHLEKTRRDYIANVSHELRTPISSIRAISETLCEKEDLGGDKKNQYYNIILRESMRLQKLINDMLELSRLQSGEMSMVKSMVEGKKLISDIAEYFEIFSEDTGIRFIASETLADLPDFYSNESRITQVLFILLDNAFKFAQAEGYVKLDAYWDDEVITIVVENTGEGISDKDIDFVFERFFKSDASHNAKGSGLGLSIASEIIKNLEEEIHVTSEQDGLTRFRFTLHRNGALN